MHPAIDVHAHYGDYEIPAGTVQGDLLRQFYSADLERVLFRAAAVDVTTTIVSPLKAFFPDGSHCVEANEDSVRLCEEYDHVGFWAVLNPLQPETFPQVTQLLTHPRCAGIKIHPVTHGYDITDEGDRLLDFAAEHDAVTISHSGQNGAMPRDFVAPIKAHPDVRFILAHLGNSDARDPTEQVRALQEAESAHVYVDTSSMNSMLSGLIEWAVRELGSEHILFGTDTPLYSVAAQKARIEHAEISDQDKQNILYDNATHLLEKD